MNNQIKSPASCDKLDSLKHTRHDDNTLSAQRQRILNELLSGKSLTTLQARNELNVMHPAGRIMELRRQGLNIKTHWKTVNTPQSKHRVAEYFLSGMGGEK